MPYVMDRNPPRADALTIPSSGRDSGGTQEPGAAQSWAFVFGAEKTFAESAEGFGKGVGFVSHRAADRRTHERGA